MDWIRHWNLILLLKLNLFCCFWLHLSYTLLVLTPKTWSMIFSFWALLTCLSTYVCLRTYNILIYESNYYAKVNNINIILFIWNFFIKNYMDVYTKKKKQLTFKSIFHKLSIVGRPPPLPPMRIFTTMIFWEGRTWKITQKRFA